MDRNIIVLTDEDGADVRFELLDVVEHGGDDFAVLLPADEEAEMFMILRADPDPANPEDYLFSGIEDQKLIDKVFAKFRKRHPEIFEES
ncbi:MAG TPA: DUF1292 domain-containing protein [Ruminococcus sp.]|nr:DUF1292 domain-containing protein [Ruminococcus sp.]